MPEYPLPSFALLENSLDQKAPCFYFSEPESQIIAEDQKSLQAAFRQIKIAQQKGLFPAGYLSYEAAFSLKPALHHLQRENDPKPLLHFVAFHRCENSTPETLKALKNCPQAAISLMENPLSFSGYQKQFDQVTKALQSGDSYQVNLTTRLTLKSPCDLLALYQTLKAQQKVAYSAYLPFLPKTLLSFSPELFFKKTGQKITVRPMKGTAPRSDNAEKDRQYYRFLQEDQKNRAENLIIVDLLRNDLAAFCDTGTIKLEQAFDIERYQSVYQMTSTISAKCAENISLEKILSHLFPCGSITGAPKRRTMEIIKQLENKRGVYSGSIGYILPNNDMCFNVAIRTLEVENHRIAFGVGGGITLQSSASDEWQEMQTKLHFLKGAYQPPFDLVESLYYQNGYRSFKRHLARFKASAHYFCFTYNQADIESALNHYPQGRLKEDKAYKIRIVLTAKGVFNIEHILIETLPDLPLQLYLCPERINQNHQLWQHKTTDKSTRGFYTEMQQKYIGNLANSELIYLNQKGHVTEARFHNLMILLNGEQLTPKQSDGLLPGIYRQKLLENGQVKEAHICTEMLKNAEAIYLMNDVRGQMPAVLVPGVPQQLKATEMRS